MGSILSIIDNNPIHETSFAVEAAVAASGEATAGTARREGVSGTSPLSERSVEEEERSDRRKVETQRRIPQRSKSDNSTVPPSESKKENRNALALTRQIPAANLKSKSDTRGCTTQQGRAMESPESRSNDWKVGSGKENEETAGTSTQLRCLSGNRMPLSPIAERPDQVLQQQREPMIFETLTATARIKKAHPAATNSGLGRNGAKVSSTSAIDELRNNFDEAVVAKHVIPVVKDVMKVPVDPPGAILGARPLMQYPNSHPQLVSYAEHGHGPTNIGGGYHYGGGLDHRSFQPIIPAMTNNWGYHPSHQHHHQPHQIQHYQQHQMQQQQQQHCQQQQRQFDVSNHQQRQQERPIQQQWSMPHFLAPLVATVRHPFSHFISVGNGIHSNPWSPTAGDHHFGHTLHNGTNIQHNIHKDQDSPHPDTDADVMSANTSMDSFEQDIKEVVTNFIPSTFAPPECIEKIIKARNKAASHLNQQRQTRSMTSQIISRNDSSKLKTTNPIAALAITHQACSSRTFSLSRGKAKVVPLPENGSVCGTDTLDMLVRTILGKKVTIIDVARKVFVIDLLSPEVCDQIRMMADDHTREIHKSGSGAENWRTLYTYTKMDLPAVEVKDLVKKYTEQILHDVKKIVGEVFGGDMRKQAMHLRPRSWKEPHLLLYQRLDDRPDHTGIEMHYDGCDITWQAMLTRLDEYEGGGTYFRALQKTILLRQGQVLVHPGELYHMGIDIKYGVRCLLVCFTDGANPKILDDSKSDEDCPEYRKNTVLC